MIFASIILVQGDILYYPARRSHCCSVTRVTLKTLKTFGNKFPFSNVVFKFGYWLPFFFSSCTTQSNLSNPVDAGEDTLTDYNEKWFTLLGTPAIMA